MDYLEYKNYLAHHGILGMHWGIRRYQNKDGTLTAAGKRRYGIDTTDKNYRISKADLMRSTNLNLLNDYSYMLSSDEIRDRLERIKQEDRLKFAYEAQGSKLYKTMNTLGDIADKMQGGVKFTKTVGDLTLNASLIGKNLESTAQFLNKATGGRHFTNFATKNKNNKNAIDTSWMNNADKKRDTEIKRYKQKLEYDKYKNAYEQKNNKSTVQKSNNDVKESTRLKPTKNDNSNGTKQKRASWKSEKTGTKLPKRTSDVGRNQNGLFSKLVSSVVSNYGNSDIYNSFASSNIPYSYLNDFERMGRRLAINEVYHSDDLAHHGILGMHWGIRRYQNKDGSYTAEGLKRYAETNRDYDIQKLKKEADSINKKYSKKTNKLRLAAERKTFSDRMMVNRGDNNYKKGLDIDNNQITNTWVLNRNNNHLMRIRQRIDKVNEAYDTKISKLLTERDTKLYEVKKKVDNLMQMRTEELEKYYGIIA